MTNPPVCMCGSVPCNSLVGGGATQSSAAPGSSGPRPTSGPSPEEQAAADAAAAAAAKEALEQSEVIDCGANGEYSRDSKACKCNMGFEGEMCEYKTCPNKCSGKNGFCDAVSGKCTCADGFDGEDCKNFIFDLILNFDWFCV